MTFSRFPFRLFTWFVTRQILLMLLALGILGLGLSFWVFVQKELPDGAQNFSIFLIFVTLCFAFILCSLIALFLTRKMVIPLGRLIEKTRRLRKFPFRIDEMTEDELAYDEPGEWYELERALNKLGRDLQQKTIRLSREKTEFRAIISSMSEAILAVDVAKHPLFYNPQFAITFNIDGVKSDDVMMSEFIRDPEVLQAYEVCLKTGETQRVKLDWEVMGVVHHFHVSVGPLRKKHNQEIYGAVAVFNDVTDLKKAERIRIDFVGNVSHELRTPLTSVMGYLQTVKMDIQSGNAKDSLEFLSIVEKNVERLKLLVDDLLDLSQLESGQGVHKKWMQTREITEAVLNMIPSKDHVIHLSFEVDQVEADAARVEQVLRNLLANAVRYVPKGRNIWIHWGRDQQGSVILKVKDDGPGISPQHRERLFERFYRIDESRSRELGGTGIGLSLVKHIMASHGGSVQLSSEPGEGAEFTCVFP